MQIPNLSPLCFSSSFLLSISPFYLSLPPVPPLSPLSSSWFPPFSLSPSLSISSNPPFSPFPLTFVHNLPRCRILLLFNHASYSTPFVSLPLHSLITWRLSPLPLHISCFFTYPFSVLFILPAHHALPYFRHPFLHACTPVNPPSLTCLGKFAREIPYSLYSLLYFSFSHYFCFLLFSFVLLFHTIFLYFLLFYLFPHYFPLWFISPLFAFSLFSSCSLNQSVA